MAEVISRTMPARMANQNSPPTSGMPQPPRPPYQWPPIIPGPIPQPPIMLPPSTGTRRNTPMITSAMIPISRPLMILHLVFERETGCAAPFPSVSHFPSIYWMTYSRTTHRLEAPEGAGVVGNHQIHDALIVHGL